MSKEQWRILFLVNLGLCVFNMVSHFVTGDPSAGLAWLCAACGWLCAAIQTIED